MKLIVVRIIKIKIKGLLNVVNNWISVGGVFLCVILLRLYNFSCFLVFFFVSLFKLVFSLDKVWFKLFLVFNVIVKGFLLLLLWVVFVFWNLVIMFFF